MADIPEHNLVYTYEWNQFTNVYNKFGYYMLFNKGRMIVMLSQKDMPDDMKGAVVFLASAASDSSFLTASLLLLLRSFCLGR